MRRRLLCILVLGVALSMLAACGAVGTPSPGATSSPGTATSTATGAAQTVQVTLSDQQITADPSTLYAGQPYRFVVTNTGQVAYQFMMVAQGANCMGGHMSQQGCRSAAMYMYDEITPGQMRTFDHTFPATAVGRSYGFACYRSNGGSMWYPFTVQAHP